MSKKASEPKPAPSLRTFFLPELGVSVEASTLEEAIKKAKAGEITQEDSDA